MWKWIWWPQSNSQGILLCHLREAHNCSSKSVGRYVPTCWQFYRKKHTHSPGKWSNSVDWLFSRIVFCVAPAQKMAERESIFFPKFHVSFISIYSRISGPWMFMVFRVLVGFFFFFALQCRSIWQVAGHEMTFHSHVISGFYLIFLLIIYVKLSRALCSSNAVLLTAVSK